MTRHRNDDAANEDERARANVARREHGAHGVLEALNAEGVVEHPGDPEAVEPADPAADAEAPPPFG